MEDLSFPPQTVIADERRGHTRPLSPSSSVLVSDPVGKATKDDTRTGSPL